MKRNRNTLTDIGLLVLVTLVAYLPVSFSLLSLKNDSLVQYLPFRYHLSESIQNGHFPFWSPYLYTGFPVHADMQGMTWNPLVLLISLFTKYNMSVLEFEVTVYLLLAAISMYFLLRSFQLHRVICILGGISYMSCGFITGSASVIPWISSAAFIPFVFLTLKGFLDEPGVKKAIYFSFSLSLLFLCGYPTFFIYTSYITGAVLLLALWVHFRKKERASLQRPLLCFGLAILLFLLVCSPAIISYAEFLSYYSRGSGISAARAAQNPFTPFSSISYLVPGAVHKDHPWLDTDTSMRNGYVGLFVFLLFVLSLFSKQGRWQKMIGALTLFSFLLSLGSSTPLHYICYKALPLFNTFRHPGNIRLFTSLGIIMLASIYTQQLLQGNREEIYRKLRTMGWATAGILGVTLLILLLKAGTRENLQFAIRKGPDPKALLDAFSFDGFLLLQCVAQLVFVGALLSLLRQKKLPVKLTAVLVGLNSVLFCWLALPFNFVSQLRTAAIDQYVASFPKGYPAPDLLASAETGVFADSSTIPVYGYANFYNKQIRLQDYVITPTLNKEYERFCGDKKLRRAMDGYPFAWLSDTLVSQTPDSLFPGRRFSLYSDPATKPVLGKLNGMEKMEVEKFSPNSFTLRTNTRSPLLLSVFQQYNHNWQVRINDQPASVIKLNIAFMGVALPAGENRVVWEYRPARVVLAAWISLATLIICGLFFIFTYRKPGQLAKN